MPEWLVLLLDDTHRSGFFKLNRDKLLLLQSMFITDEELVDEEDEAVDEFWLLLLLELKLCEVVLFVDKLPSLDVLVVGRLLGFLTATGVLLLLLVLLQLTRVLFKRLTEEPPLPIFGVRVIVGIVLLVTALAVGTLPTTTTAPLFDGVELRLVVGFKLEDAAI
jgi:hypothetical protein